MPTSWLGLARERLKTIAETVTALDGKCVVLPNGNAAGLECWKRYAAGEFYFLAACGNGLAYGGIDATGSGHGPRHRRKRPHPHPRAPPARADVCVRRGKRGVLRALRQRRVERTLLRVRDQGALRLCGEVLTRVVS